MYVVTVDLVNEKEASPRRTSEALDPSSSISFVAERRHAGEVPSTVNLPGYVRACW